MSLMAPGLGGQALLSGMQIGFQQHQLRQKQATAADDAAAKDEQRRIAADAAKIKADDAFQEDWGRLRQHYSEALPGDEGLLSYEYDQLRATYPERQLPSLESLGGMTRHGGFGTRSDPAKLISGDQALADADAGGKIQAKIFNLPNSDLLDPQAFASHEADIAAFGRSAGLNLTTIKPYIEALYKRRDMAASQITNGVTLARDRQQYINTEKDKLLGRLKMAYGKGADLSAFGGGSGFDTDYNTSVNIIMARGEQIIADAYDQGRFVSADAAMAQMRDEYRNAEPLQKALGNQIKGPGGMLYVPQRQDPFQVPQAPPLPLGVAAPGNSNTFPAVAPGPNVPDTPLAPSAPAAADPATMSGYQFLGRIPLKDGSTGEQIRLPDGTVVVKRAGYWAARRSEIEGTMK